MLIRVLILLLLLMPTTSVFAQAIDQTFGSWNVYTLKSDNNKICYISAFPEKETGNYKKRGKPYMIIVNVSNNVDEVQVTSGYPYARNSDAELKYDGGKIDLMTKHEIAWAKDRAVDAKIVNLMQKGSKISVRGTSTKGTFSEDTYALSGFSKAYKRMKELCAE